jgi:hypothetical protein
MLCHRCRPRKLPLWATADPGLPVLRESAACHRTKRTEMAPGDPTSGTAGEDLENSSQPNKETHGGPLIHACMHILGICIGQGYHLDRERFGPFAG